MQVKIKRITRMIFRVVGVARHTRRQHELRHGRDRERITAALWSEGAKGSLAVRQTELSLVSRAKIMPQLDLHRLFWFAADAEAHEARAKS